MSDKIQKPIKTEQKTIDGLVEKGLIEIVGYDTTGNRVYQNTELGNLIADELEKQEKMSTTIFPDYFEIPLIDTELDDEDSPLEEDEVYIDDGADTEEDDLDDDETAYNDGIEWDEY